MTHLIRFSSIALILMTTSCTAIFIPKKHFVSHLYFCLFLVSDLLPFLCRGSKDKCPVAIADLVLLHNKAQEGAAKRDRLGFDIYNGIDINTKVTFFVFSVLFC